MQHVNDYFCTTDIWDLSEINRIRTYFEIHLDEVVYFKPSFFYGQGL